MMPATTVWPAAATDAGPARGRPRARARRVGSATLAVTLALAASR